MKQLHLILTEDTPAIQWANAQADRVGARGHVGTHLDCYTAVPKKNEYKIEGIVLDCKEGMPSISCIESIGLLENKALILHTGNLDQNRYGTEEYFNKDTSLSEETLNAVLNKKPLFIIIDSHGIATKGAKHIAFDKLCETKGCHVIENVDLSCMKDRTSVLLKIVVDISHPSTGKPCQLYCI